METINLQPTPWKKKKMFIKLNVTSAGRTAKARVKALSLL